MTLFAIHVHFAEHREGHTIGSAAEGFDLLFAARLLAQELSRDYPVMFGTLYIFTLIGLLLNIISDISYTLVDPRIDFEGR
jgi:ABC-type microcin C transport system permease subunit YejB